MPARIPSDRALIGAIGAHQSWANTNDRPARTLHAREAFLNRFERLVDPDGALTQEERARRATSARRAYFLRLALLSAKARRGDGDAA
jgi:hypothetical protein